MPPVADAPRSRAFADLLRAARAARGASQEQVIAQTGISRATYLRWEAGDVGRPEPAQVTAVCRFLGINPSHAALALGFGEAADYNVEPDDDLVADIRRTLANTKISATGLAALRHALAGALEAWRMAMHSRAPHEPN
ncbi:helix-turn-helix transcriptional regulator [Dactylosporangium sp. NPDC051485]|uniref:helix-turn-helix domain-containing protein n=1 Tax=Dactylosporangium sp. NPDC051485 TaxID=3154846 RepID=UPI003435BB9C